MQPVRGSLKKTSLHDMVCLNCTHSLKAHDKFGCMAKDCGCSKKLAFDSPKRKR